MQHLYELPELKSGDINKKMPRLETNLVAFPQITKIPISFFSNNGKYIWSTMDEARICSANTSFGTDDFICTRNLISSMNISLSLPEAYIFMCEAGLIHLCNPLALDGHVYGFLIAGPIAMGTSMEKHIGSLSNRIVAFEVDYARLIPLIKNMNMYKPSEISYLNTLFQNAINSVMGGSPSASLANQQYKEQTEIGEKLISLKKERINLEYPCESENELANIIKSGNVDLCKKGFGKYMEDIIVFEGGNMSLVKLRLIGFFTHITQNQYEWQTNFDQFFYLERINESQTLKEMHQFAISLILTLTESMAQQNYSGGSSVIKEVVSYVSTNFKEDITLSKLAEHVHVNSTYLSTLFKQEMGIPFTTYLNNIRLSHSEELLRTSYHSITEICLMVGFTSPSYFTKVFKKHYGIGPREYRLQYQ